MMLPIDFLKFQSQLNIRKQDGQVFIHDPIRKKYLVQTPEEVVRQLVLGYLMEERQFPKNRIRTEKVLKVNELTKRCDILVFDWGMQNFLLAECKAPSVRITEATFRQIASYNLPLRVAYLLVTNGIETYCCEMDYTGGNFKFIGEVPTFPGQSSR